MTFLPGGDPKIPNQLPNPYGSPSLGASSSAPQQTEPSAPLVTSAERQRALARLFIRLAVIGAVLLGGATIIARWPKPIGAIKSTIRIGQFWLLRSLSSTMRRLG